jgi:hypothetical protein
MPHKTQVFLIVYVTLAISYVLQKFFNVTSWFLIEIAAIVFWTYLAGNSLIIFFWRMWPLKWTKRNLRMAFRAISCFHFNKQHYCKRLKSENNTPVLKFRHFCIDCRESLKLTKAETIDFFQEQACLTLINQFNKERKNGL